MKLIKTTLMALGCAAILASCSGRDNENPTGSWTSAAPQSVTQGVDGAKTASKIVNIDFEAPGTLVYSADYEVTAPNLNDSVASDITYKVTASINGTWKQQGDDKDEYLLTFDKNTLSVNGTDAPELGPVTDEFLSSLDRLTTIDDVEVSKDGGHMTFELKNPKAKLAFVKK